MVSSIIKLALFGIVGIIGIIVATRAIQSIGNFQLFPDANADDGKQLNTSDSEAQLGKVQAELQRADAETIRATVSADRAEAEGKRGDAEALRAIAEQSRANAEILRAENDRLSIELSAKAGTLTTNTIIGQESDNFDARKEASKESGDSDAENPELTDTESASGQTDLDQAPNTDIKGSDTTVEISVENDSEDAVIKAISSRKSRPRSSFFSRGSTSQVVVTSDRPDVKITGAGSALEGTQAFIFDKPLRNLSDVLKKFPNKTASQARDFLSRQGTFQNKEAEKSFKAFDFGTNTGNAIRPDSEVIKGSVTKTALEREEIRANKRLEAILSSREQSSGVTAIKPVINEIQRRRNRR